MPHFSYTPLLPTGPDETRYRLLGTDGVSTVSAPGRNFVQDEPPALELLARTASGRWRSWRTTELGMEAVWRIEVENFPAFVVVDDKGNDLFRPAPAGATPVTIGRRAAS